MAPPRNYLIHPQYIMLTLVIAGISALFIGFTVSFLYSRIQQNIPPIQLPWLFYFNTILIIGSSVTILKAQSAFKKDNIVMFRNMIWLTLLLTVSFLIMQIFAWLQLEIDQISINYNTLASYIFLISGLHFLHLVAGIPFLIYFLYVAYKRTKDPVTVLVYFADPDKKRSLTLLNIYWHFLDILWVYILLFFLVNYLI